MQKIFGNDGVLASHLNGYEPRPGQLEMAEAVAELIQESGEYFSGEGEAACLVVEAETGLGKTLAYLVPAALSGRKVVVSTNTKNLQDQILTREIPFIRRHLDPDLKAICVKGRENYLCLHRWHQYLAARQAELFDGSLSDRIAEWLSKTTFADRAELSFLTGKSPLWRSICCQSHSCSGTECLHYKSCYLTKLRKEAASCRLLVVNHHLLFSDLAVRRGGYGEVLPRYEAVIFDEAHHLENIATTFFGFSLSRYQVKDLLADIERNAESALSAAQKKKLFKAINSASGTIERFAALLPAEKGRYPVGDLFAQTPGFDKLRGEVISGFERLGELLDTLKQGDQPWEQYQQRCAELAGRFAAITNTAKDDIPEETERFIHWYERTERNVSISATPIDVADDIRETLLASVSGCVFTSATLGTNGDFSYFCQRLGLPEETHTLAFPSPFDYKNQTLLYVPDKQFPEPATPGYAKVLHREIESLINSSRGRALVLFTSIQAMKAAYHQLRDTLPYPVLMQGNAPRHELLTRFAGESESVLFGVASFWEGVDVAGESLSLVIIDKIPFEVPSDPVIMARMNQIRQNGGNPFFDFQIPRAIITLRQGVGRLMRKGSDRGVIAILDARLFSKGYGRRFLNNLPASPLVRDRQRVQSFFESLAHDTTETG